LKPGKPVPQAKAAAIVRRIALGLEVAHAAGVIHRDLKPANVMLHKSGEPAVTDFGLAKRLATAGRSSGGDTRLTRDGAVMGSTRRGRGARAAPAPALVSRQAIV
jgi:serine/threonine protein kinase